VKVVLLDVGGVLWPDRPVRRESPNPRLQRLSTIVPRIAAAPVLEELEREARRLEGAIEQDTPGVIRRVLARQGLPASEIDTERVRAAMVVPAAVYFPLFPGAADLLVTLRREGFRVFLISNAAWRSGAEYLCDMEDLNVGNIVEAAFSSVDIGRRKPDPALMIAALTTARATPDQAICVGNREDLDIIPAVSLGLATVRVCIEEPPPISRSHAWRIATSPQEIAEACGAWAADRERGRPT
jgi:FMN phosphatase YigB (HAD superfamily)